VTVERLSRWLQTLNRDAGERRQERMTSEMIACCGLDCNECRAFKATQAKDTEWKKQIAKQWTE
jgi:hypothetical protein